MRRLLLILIVLCFTPIFGQGASRQSFGDWQISYQIPEGWQLAQQFGRAHMLMAGQDNTALIFVAPSKYENAGDVSRELTTFFSSLGVNGYPTENPTETTFQGKKAISAAFAGTNQLGQSLKARFLSIFTGQGTNFNIMVLGTANHFPQLGNLVDKIGATVSGKAPVINRQLMANLAGTWVYYSGSSQSSIGSMGGYSQSYEEFLTLDGQGNYRWNSNGHVAATSSTSSDGSYSSASDISGNQDAGRYEIVGSTLIIYSPRGGTQLHDFTLKGGAIVTGNRTYIRQ